MPALSGTPRTKETLNFSQDFKSKFDFGLISILTSSIGQLSKIGKLVGTKSSIESLLKNLKTYEMFQNYALGLWSCFIHQFFD